MNVCANDWKEGDPCVAMWSEDLCWYRSEITKIEPGNKVLVTFIDYGNTGYTNLESLKPHGTEIDEEGQLLQDILALPTPCGEDSGVPNESVTNSTFGRLGIDRTKTNEEGNGNPVEDETSVADGKEVNEEKR